MNALKTFTRKSNVVPQTTLAVPALPGLHTNKTINGKQRDKLEQNEMHLNT